MLARLTGGISTDLEEKQKSSFGQSRELSNYSRRKNDDQHELTGDEELGFQTAKTKALGKFHCKIAGSRGLEVKVTEGGTKKTVGTQRTQEQETGGFAFPWHSG